MRTHTHDRGADVTIEAAGAPEAVVQAMRWTRDAGRVVIVGQYTDHGEVAFNPHRDLNRKHLDVRGCWGSDYSHFHRAVQIMRDPAAAQPWRLLPLQRFPLADANRAVDLVAEGMVVKAWDWVVKGPRGLAQPAIKCRGAEYLRIIYGAEYTLPGHLERLRARGLAAKRSLALREYALGLEGLYRFVENEPFYRVHECVFGVLALESEPVDPRL